MLRDASQNTLDGRAIEISEAQILDSTFVATRGAAEFRKRVVENPEGCAEPEICRW